MRSMVNLEENVQKYSPASGTERFFNPKRKREVRMCHQAKIVPVVMIDDNYLCTLIICSVSFRSSHEYLYSSILGINMEEFLKTHVEKEKLVQRTL